MAAIKYGDLSNQASKDYVFDVDRFTSFEGNTGPYILYTIVRIKSILNKYQSQGNSLDGLKVQEAYADCEKALMLEAAKYNDVMANAFQDLAPHKICAYMILPMHSIVFIMRQRFWQKKMPENKRVILRF